MESKLSESELEFLQSPQYQFTGDELQLIMSKQGERNQLLFAVMLQYYKIRLSFPTQHDSLVSYLSSTLAKKISTESCYFHEIESNHRTAKRFRQLIREHMGYRESTNADGEIFVNWLKNELLPKAPQEQEVQLAVKSYYRRHFTVRVTRGHFIAHNMTAQNSIESYLMFLVCFNKLT